MIIRDRQSAEQRKFGKYIRCGVVEVVAVLFLCNFPVAISGTEPSVIVRVSQRLLLRRRRRPRCRPIAVAGPLAAKLVADSFQPVLASFGLLARPSRALRLSVAGRTHARDYYPQILDLAIGTRSGK